MRIGAMAGANRKIPRHPTRLQHLHSDREEIRDAAQDHADTHNEVDNATTKPMLATVDMRQAAKKPGGMCIRPFSRRPRAGYAQDVGEVHCDGFW